MYRSPDVRVFDAIGGDEHFRGTGQALATASHRQGDVEDRGRRFDLLRLECRLRRICETDALGVLHDQPGSGSFVEIGG